MDSWKALERWDSDRLHQPISLARWGHYGVPVLVFPTAGGDAEEIERHQLVAHLTPLIEEGRIKVYSCDSVAGRAMTADEGSVEYRCWLFNQFQQAIAYEVVPAIHADSAGPQEVIVAGASIGAFNSLALISRWPHLFRSAICMSGTYDIEKFIGGFTDGSVLFLPAALPARAGGAGPRPPPRAVRLSAVGIGRVGGRRRVVAGLPRSSAPRVCPTGSTTGAPTSNTTGRPGGRCSPTMSSKHCSHRCRTIAPRGL